MSQPLRVENVKVVDNGVRTFVPPCFCFDLHGEAGVVETVSQILLPSGEVLECGFSGVDRDRFDPDEHHAGFIEGYAAGPRAEQGKRFVVT